MNRINRAVALGVGAVAMGTSASAGGILPLFWHHSSFQSAPATTSTTPRQYNTPFLTALHANTPAPPPVSSTSTAARRVAAASVDPYSSNGTWQVPSQIPPGTYRTALAAWQTNGYYTICADCTCEPNTPGFIRIDFLNGPGVVMIPPNAASIKLNNLILTPMAPA